MSSSQNGSTIATPSGEGVVDVRGDIVDAERDIVGAGASAADTLKTSSSTAFEEIPVVAGAAPTAVVDDTFMPDPAEDSSGFHTPPSTISTTSMNGLRNGTNNMLHNGTVPGTNASAQAVLQRGLEVLKESEVDNSIEEIKKLDSQIDHFNNYLDKFEARNKALNEKLNNILETQKEERLKRRASFQQKEAEYKEQNEALEDQMRALLNRCHQARRISAAPDVPLGDGGHVMAASGQSNGSAVDHASQS